MPPVLQFANPHLQAGHGGQHRRHRLLADVKVAGEAQAAHVRQGAPLEQHFIANSEVELNFELPQGRAGAQLAGRVRGQLDAQQAA